MGISLIVTVTFHAMAFHDVRKYLFFAKLA